VITRKTEMWWRKQTLPLEEGMLHMPVSFALVGQGQQGRVRVPKSALLPDWKWRMREAEKAVGPR